MLKILEKMKKKTETSIQKYTQKDIDELSKILNRPREGEIVKISNIKIPKKFKKPNYNKIARRKEYFKKYGYFRSTVILNDKNYLVDGYTTYLLAKEMKFDYITILREEVKNDRLQKRIQNSNKTTNSNNNTSNSNIHTKQLHSSKNK